MSENVFPYQRYPFAQREGDELFKALTESITDPDSIDLLYKQAHGVVALNLQWSIQKLWIEALDQISLAGELTTLLRNLATHPYARVSACATALLTAPPPSRRGIISSDVVILDRTTLRDGIEKVVNDNSRCKVIIVRGAPRSGKTHGWYLFEEAGRNYGAEVVYLADGMVFEVRDVVETLFGYYNASSQVPPGDATDTAWYRTVCLKLRELADSHRRPLWIAVDGLGLDEGGNPLLDPEILRFFQIFGWMLMSPAFNKWFRLMLIHYPDNSRPTRWPPELCHEDTTAESDVQLHHVEACLLEWAKTAGRELHAEQARKEAQRVVDAADVTPEGVESTCRLRRIHEVLIGRFRELASEPT